MTPPATPGEKCRTCHDRGMVETMDDNRSLHWIECPTCKGRPTHGNGDAAAALKPCPFCGSVEIFVEEMGTRCKGCGCFGPMRDENGESGHMKPLIARAAWNRRVIPGRAGEIDWEAKFREAQEADQAAGLEAEEYREVLEDIRQTLCDAACPTIWKTADGRPHCEACAKVTKVLSEYPGWERGPAAPSVEEASRVDCRLLDVPFDAPLSKALDQEIDNFAADTLAFRQAKERVGRLAKWERLLAEACGGSHPSSGHDVCDEVCGLLRVTRDQRDQAWKELAEARAALAELFKNSGQGCGQESGQDGAEMRGGDAEGTEHDAGCLPPPEPPRLTGG